MDDFIMDTKVMLAAIIFLDIAVGIPITGHPPHRSRRAQFTHRAPTLGVWRQTFGLATDEECGAMVATLQQVASFGPIQ